MRPLAPPTSPPQSPDRSAAPARPRTTGFSAIATPLPTRPPTDDDERDRRTHEEDGHTASSRIPRFFDSYVWVKRKARIGSTPLSTTLSAPRPSFYLYLGGFSLRVRCEPLGRNEQQNEPSYRFSLVPGETPTTQVITFRTSSRLRS